MSPTTSASCSIAPDSRRSDSWGFGGLRCSTARLSCESAITGTFNSLARALRERVMLEISCWRLSVRPRVYKLQIVHNDEGQVPQFHLQAPRFGTDIQR